MHYFTWKLEFGWNILFMTVGKYYEDFCKASQWKINWTQWFLFFFHIPPLDSLNLGLLSGAKLYGHRGTWTGCVNGQGKCQSLDISSFFLDQKRTWNYYNFVDDCIILLTKEGYKVVATWHRTKNWFITS